jgi:tetratricopeptide (TPR) repeat protein
MKKIWVGVFIISLVFFHCAAGKVPVSSAKPESTKSYISCLARGMQLLEQKQYDEAISEFKQATILKADSGKAFNFLGIAFCMKKNYAEALACFQKSLALDPAYAAAICNLGNLQFETGEVDAAVETLNKGLMAFADNVALHFSLGNILLHRGELDPGFAHLKKVMELDPGYLEREKKFSMGTSASDLPRSEISFRYARLYASAGNLEKTLEYLENAKKTGFVDWSRLRQDDAFVQFRDDPRIKQYLD